MLITCDNKGCLTQSEALLDVESGEVICKKCKRPIINVASHTKTVMKSLGQVIRDKAKKMFMMACKHCVANRKVVLDEKNNPVCEVCGSEIKVPQTMKEALLSEKKSEADTKKKPGRPKKQKQGK